MMILGRNIAGRVIGMIVGGLFLLALVGFGLSQCSSRKTAEKQAEVAEGQSGAAIDAGAAAVGKAAEIVASDAATDAQVAAAQAEIRAATTGQKGKAAKKAACRFKAYRDTPQCREPTP